MNEQATLSSNAPYGAVLVVGGGIAGIQSALDLASQGFKVYLVEESTSVGGNMSMLDKTFPTNDCSTCMLSPRLVEVARHKNITLLTLASLEELTGEPGRFQATVRQAPRYIDPEKCVGCGICAQKCPKAVLDEFNMGLSKRKAAFLRFPQAVPLIYSIDKENCIYFAKGTCKACEKFCQSNAIDFEQKETVLKLDVGAVILATGFETAPGNIRPELGYGRSKNVLTGLEFERVLAASGPYAGHVQRPSDHVEPQRVAWIQCVGSRDAALKREFCSSVCCLYATKQAILATEHVKGLEATVIYMDVRTHGKNAERYFMRAERDHGVRYVRGKVADVSEDPETGKLDLTYFSADKSEIVKEAFDMVVLSVGLAPGASSRALAANLGLDADQYGFVVPSGLDPLMTSRPGVFVCGLAQAPRDIPDTVVQASGAAAEAAALLAEARSSEDEGAELVEERDISGEPPRIGVFVCHCGTNIAGVVDVEAVVAEAKGLPYVEHAENLLFACATDSHKKIAEAIKTHRLNRVVVSACSPRTHEPLFQQTLKESGLNPYLFTQANIRDQCSWVHAQDPVAATAKARSLMRMAVARAALSEPLHTQESPVEQSGLVVGGGIAGMTAALALAEQGFRAHLVEKTDVLGGIARRLTRTLEGHDVPAYLADLEQKLAADDRITVHLSSEVAKFSGYVGAFETDLRSGSSTEKVRHGVVIVTTGAEEYQPTEFLGGQDERVFTQLDLNERLHREENVLDGVTNVVMIQCVGSRDEEHPACSRICCTTAVANALKIKEINPEIEVTVLFRDIRTFGLKELFYIEAARKGVHFVRFDPERPPVVENGEEGLEVTVYDRDLQDEIVLTADRLVLSAAVRPRQDTRPLMEALKLQTDSDGFFMEAHLKLRPVDLATTGFYLAGLAQGPKFLEESIAQARAAAARAAIILSKTSISVGGKVAVVSPEKCAVCLTCVRTCPYGVPYIGPDHYAVIEPALCQGCGACVSECPGKAITLKHNTDAQILAKMQAMSA